MTTPRGGTFWPVALEDNLSIGFSLGHTRGWLSPLIRGRVKDPYIVVPHRRAAKSSKDKHFCRRNGDSSVMRPGLRPAPTIVILYLRPIKIVAADVQLEELIVWTWRAAEIVSSE